MDVAQLHLFFPCFVVRLYALYFIVGRAKLNYIGLWTMGELEGENGMSGKAAARGF